MVLTRLQECARDSNTDSNHMNVHSNYITFKRIFHIRPSTNPGYSESGNFWIALQDNLARGDAGYGY